jgi:hypothetical protein
MTAKADPSPADLPGLVSWFSRGTENLPDQDIPAAEFVFAIRNGQYRREIKQIRDRFKRAFDRTNGNNEAAKKTVGAAKNRLPAVTFSGVFGVRSEEQFQKHSGLLQADCDLLGERLPELREVFKADPHVYALFVSPTGDGLKAIYRGPVCPDKKTHAAAQNTVAAHIKKLCGLEIDHLIDLSRLCYASYDPEAWLNEQAIELPIDPVCPAPTPNATSDRPTASNANLTTRQQLAVQILGPVRWENGETGFCDCPGKTRHTNPDREKDCQVWINGVPSIKCMHTSCAPIVDGVNHSLRSAVAKAEWAPQAQAAPADTLTASADIRGFIVRTLLGKDAAFQQRQQIADAVVAEISKAGRLYHHAELRDFDTAMYFHSGRNRLERIRSDSFQSWLSDWLAINRADNLFRHVQAAIETAALSSTAASAIIPASYWHATPEAVYLSNGDGQLVCVTARGLELCANGKDGVLFAAGKTLRPWSVKDRPADPFETCRLFRDTRAAATHGKHVLRIWTYSLPTNPRCKPPLCLSGDVGSGKTRLAAGIAELYGLPFNAQKVEESSEADFWPTLDNGGLVCFDNADTRSRWLADALACASTGGSNQRRRLYTNLELVTLRANAWLAVTTANPTFANDAGLADRLLLVRTHRAEGDTSDSALSDEIQANRDAALVHVAETLAAAFRDTEPTPGGLNARHPDFAAFGVRIGRALNREAETVAALRSAEADKSAFCVENDAIATALLAYVNTAGTFTGTAADLLPHLVEIDGELREQTSAKRLGKRLTALWPHLAKVFGTVRREINRKGFNVFTLIAKPADFAEFQTAIS